MLIFEILIIQKPSLGSCEVQHKIWARSVRRFDVYWIQTNRHPDRQAKNIYRRRDTELNWSARVGFIIIKYVLSTIRENRKKILKDLLRISPPRNFKYI